MADGPAGAVLVWDGGDVKIPALMGVPRLDQMLGNPAEQLTELRLWRSASVC